MASNDCYSQVKDSIDKSQRNRKSEHEETIKVDQMKTAKKASNSIDEKAHIEDFDETQLKSLLDEAMDYKNPRDANDKSEAFKQLLKNVTEEDMKHNQRYSLGTHGLKQSNSLQNLLDDSHYQSSSNQSHTSSKKHKHRKNSTSVSTRRLEGGSLPIDMHHSSAVQSPPDQPFLSEYKNSKKRKEKQQTVMDAGDVETDEKKLMQRHFESGSLKDGISSSSYLHDGIEMKSMMSYTNSVDLEVQEPKFINIIPSSITTISSMSPSGGPPLATTSIINPKVTSSTAATNSTMQQVDEIIKLPSLIEKPKSYQQPQQIIDMCSGSTVNHNNNIVLANHTLNFAGSTSSAATAVQLSCNYNAVSSVINTGEKSAIKNKPEIVPAQSLIANPPSSAANSKEAKSKAKRVRAAERNEKTINVESIQGFRGNDELDDLLKYIEDGGGKNQKNPKNGIVNSAASEHLKKAKNNKEKVNKLKKSNSMDELISTGRQQQQQSSDTSTATAANKIIQDVTLRSKSSGLTSGAKKTGEKVEKRNERRSWGTEGLRTDVEIESNSSSETVEVPVAVEPPIVIDSEFHVVMKKRKVKRKSSETGEKPNNALQQYRRDNARTRNYNDREAAKNVRNSSKPLNQDAKSPGGKNRRKSTSSMPPSDDDYNSDGGDSVQSLPIETTKTTSSQLLAGKNSKKQQQQNQQQQKPATFSYADIAKTNNRAVSTASTDKWPSITSSTSSSSHQTNNSNSNNDPFAIVNFDAATNAATAKNHQKTSMKMSFPELVETYNHRNKQLSSENGEMTENGAEIPVRAFDNNNNSSSEQQKISYSQSLLEPPALEIDTNGNNVKVEVAATVNGKATLTKSKSVDHNNLSSIEHYPALEKTAVIKTFEKAKPKPLKPIPAKKEKLLKKSASMQSATLSMQDNCRPAVIILNDCVKPSEGDFGGITFGFDINEGLLNGADDEDVSIGNSTNNKNNCDITNTNLSCNNNLTNQPCVEIYENFIAPVPQQIVIVENNNNHMSPPQQQQQQQLDSSSQSSINDMGYLSSSLITNVNLSPASTQKSDNGLDDIVDCRKSSALRIAIEYKLVLPRFNSPEPVKFNQDELMSFVSDEWTKVVRSSVYYNGQ